MKCNWVDFTRYDAEGHIVEKRGVCPEEALETFHTCARHTPPLALAKRIKALEKECLRLNHAEAEAMALVMSHEGYITRLQKKIDELQDPPKDYPFT